MDNPPVEPLKMWAHGTFTVSWNSAAETWRIQAWALEVVPTPADGGVNQSFTQRADVLAVSGMPWCVSFDATEDRLPGVFGAK
jgi:hypothetical protein